MAPAGDFSGMEHFAYLTGKAKDKLLCPELQNILIQVPWGFCQGLRSPGAFRNSFCGAALQLQGVTNHWAQYNYTRYKTCLGIVGINHSALLFQEKKGIFSHKADKFNSFPVSEMRICL